MRRKRKILKKQKTWRVIYYCAGLVFLALGITLNTKTGLGVSPLISVPNCIADLANLNLGNCIAVYYSLMVVAQIFIKGKDFHFIDFLQAPMSVIFTRLINLFNANLDFTMAPMTIRFILLALAIICTGIGAALTIDMRLIPNAADGMVGAISDRTGRDMGLVKNLVDLSAVIVTAIIGLIFARKLLCIGVGTICTVLGVGRVVTFFNHAFKEKICEQSGI